MQKAFIAILGLFLSISALGTEPYFRADTSRGDRAYIQVAIKELSPLDSNRPKVYLVGAIHIAEKKYYDELQKNLDSYDRVLFECVSPLSFTEVGVRATHDSILKNTKDKMKCISQCAATYLKEVGKSPDNVNSLLDWYNKNNNGFWCYTLRLASKNYNDEIFKIKDGFVCDPDNVLPSIEIQAVKPPKIIEPIYNHLLPVLGFESQGKHIYYGRDHFIWCDLTDMDLFQIATQNNIDSKKLQNTLDILRGDGILGMTLQLMVKLISILPDAKETVRALIATQLLSPESQAIMNSEKDFTFLILDARNNHVLKELKKQPKTLKSIGVFYGAAHLEDIEKQWCEKEKYVPTKTIWIDAFDYNSNFKNPLLRQ